MCWSGEASAALACVGLAGTVLAAYKKQHPALWVTLGYFTSMEMLQAYTYMYIDECHLPQNQIATLLGYLHIAFQPFFINAMSMYFLPNRVRQKIQIPVYFLCFVSAIIMIIQVYPFDWAGTCHPDRPLCGQSLCSVRGNWHIAWDVPANAIFNFFQDMDLPLQGMKSGYPTYIFVGLLLPLLYGSWRLTIYHYAMGPFLASLTTDNINEWPAVWCLLSIAFLLIVVKTPVHNILFVKSFFWWPKSWRDNKEISKEEEPLEPQET
ncbi:MAG: DUF5765 domain-containing protein [Alphaproteobacteria bacterium]|nr:DUF5765 domain-containing protein [Alphaproteobacteria bacterium]